MANSQQLRLWLATVCFLNSVLPGVHGCVCRRPFGLAVHKTQILSTMTNARLHTSPQKLCLAYISQTCSWMTPFCYVTPLSALSNVTDAPTGVYVRAVIHILMFKCRRLRKLLIWRLGCRLSSYCERLCVFLQSSDFCFRVTYSPSKNFIYIFIG